MPREQIIGNQANREQYPDLSAVIVQFGYRFRLMKRVLRGHADARSPTTGSDAFVAMACPCEVLIDDAPQRSREQVVDAVAAEAWRIERKFSRYRSDSVVHRINRERRQRDRGRRGDRQPARLRRDAHASFGRRASISPRACCAKPGRSTAATACRRSSRSMRCCESVGWHKVDGADRC